MALSARGLLKAIAAIPIVMIAGAVFIWYRIGLASYLTATRSIAMVPGVAGIYIRRFFYRWTLAACGEEFIVDWMGVLKTPTISVGRRCFVGSFCFIAECVLHDEARIAHHSVVQGGPHTHGFERIDIPMADQPGAIRAVSIGPNVWIGAGARILNDVAPGTMVGAGAVVTRVFEENAILVGVPARRLRLRGSR